MLVVKVEVWPGAEYNQAFEISRIGIANVTDLADVSNYAMTAILRRDGEEQVVHSEINSHVRSFGWVPLARRALTEIHLADQQERPGVYDDPVAELLRKGHCVGR